MNVRRYALLFGLLSVCAAAGAVGVTATEGEPPLADAGLDQSVQRNSTVYLDAGGSVAPDGELVEYDWEIERPDGTPVSPACPTCERTRFRPTELGVYNATVTVTDDAGLSTSDTLRVTVVRQEPPEVSVTGPGSTVVGESPRIRLTATAGDEPLGSRIWFVDGEQYDTGFLDGSSATGSIAPPATEAGVLVIEARVTDEQGLWATDRHTVEVREESDSSDGDGGDGGDDGSEDSDDGGSEDSEDDSSEDSENDGGDDGSEDGDDSAEDETSDDSGNEPDDETDGTEDAPDPPYFAVEITGNSTASGDLTVTADITNTGNVTDGQNIRLCENSCPGSEDSRFERIAGGQTETVTLTWTDYASDTTGQTTTTIAVASDDEEDTTTRDEPNTDNDDAANPGGGYATRIPASFSNLRTDSRGLDWYTYPGETFYIDGVTELQIYDKSEPGNPTVESFPFSMDSVLVGTDEYEGLYINNDPHDWTFRTTADTPYQVVSKTDTAAELRVPESAGTDDYAWVVLQLENDPDISPPVVQFDIRERSKSCDPRECANGGDEDGGNNRGNDNVNDDSGNNDGDNNDSNDGGNDDGRDDDDDDNGSGGPGCGRICII